jgi:glycosyltransferase involved in cell wall biosynthesis
LIFIYVGILSRGRGIEELLNVFSDPAVSAHLVCMGYGDLAATIASVAKENPKVHLHPPVPHHLVVEYASGADVGLCFIENVSLSDYYCLPNKLFEYCFAGVPVLASDFPEIRKVVERFALGQVCTPKGDAMRSAVLSFIANPPGRVSADLSPLSWERQAEKLVALYQTVLGQKSRPS